MLHIKIPSHDFKRKIKDKIKPRSSNVLRETWKGFYHTTLTREKEREEQANIIPLLTHPHSNHQTLLCIVQ